MMSVISIIIIIASVLLIFVVLIQNSKGGGLDSSFGNANQLGGAAQSTETIEKATWSLAGVVGVLSIAAAMFLGTGGGTTQEVKTGITGGGAQPTSQPAAPAPVSPAIPQPNQ